MYTKRRVSQRRNVVRRRRRRCRCLRLCSGCLRAGLHKNKRSFVPCAPSFNLCLQGAAAFLANYYSNLAGSAAPDTGLKHKEEEIPDKAKEGTTTADKTKSQKKTKSKKVQPPKTTLPFIKLPSKFDSWGFGNFEDKKKGLQARVRIMDARPDVTYAKAENGDKLGTSRACL